MLTDGQRIFDDIRARWAARIGPAELDDLQTRLRELVSAGSTRFDTAGWLAGP